MMNNISFDPAAGYAIGIDVGGTKINAGLIDEHGVIVYSNSIPTMAGESAIVDRIATVISSVLAWVKEHQPTLAVRGIGIGTAGQVEWETGAIRHASNLLPGYTGMPLKSIMQKMFAMPVYVDNDVNVLALAEKYAGAGQGVRHMVCLALGTGVGGVVFDDGKIIHGKWGGAGEIGHISVDFHGLPCICGGVGCLEAYASGTSIAKRMNELHASSRETTRDNPIDTRATVKLWLSGDPIATKVMDEAFEALGSAIASLLHLLNTELVIIGGGLADAGQPLLLRIQEETGKRAMSSFLSDTRIRLSSNGNRSGMIGAAMQLWEYV